MKRIYLLIMSIVFSITGVLAQSAQVQKAAKSVFTLTTFNKDGSIHASSHGVFVGKDGEAISTWEPFVGADHAVVVDANGKTYNVDAIVGANEIYDVCKFIVEGNPIKTDVASTTANGNVYLLGYSLKKADIKTFKISSVEKFMDKYNYYIFSSTAPDNAGSCPFVNNNGQVIGLLQHSKNGDIHATDAKFAADMVANGFTISDAVLRTCGIRTALPDTENEALLTMMMAGEQTDSISRQKYIDDFIRKFPSSTEGYANKASSYVNGGKFEEADKVMQTAIEKAAKKDEAYCEYAKVIYQKELFSNKPYASWSLDKALEESKKASAINNLDIYRHQQAQIIYSKGDYQNAYDIFMALTKTKIRNGELFYEASQCKTQLKAPQKEIMNLLDSAIAACPQPLTSVAAPYVLARGIAYNEAKDYHNALIDYNEYDSLMLGRPLNSSFYYTRYKCELQVHRFQQALNDIARAIIVTPNEPTYYAEMASLQIRVKKNEDAVKAATRCTMLAPEYPDGYLLLGIANMELGNKDEAKKALEKAKTLGDKRADEYLKKI